MKKTEDTKRIYSVPVIEQIKLDNEISLALESTPPEGPGEVNLMQEFQKNDPFRTNLG